MTDQFYPNPYTETVDLSADHFHAISRELLEAADTADWTSRAHGRDGNLTASRHWQDKRRAFVLASRIVLEAGAETIDRADKARHEAFGQLLHARRAAE